MLAGGPGEMCWLPGNDRTKREQHWRYGLASSISPTTFILSPLSSSLRFSFLFPLCSPCASLRCSYSLSRSFLHKHPFAKLNPLEKGRMFQSSFHLIAAHYFGRKIPYLASTSCVLQPLVSSVRLLGICFPYQRKVARVLVG